MQIQLGDYILDADIERLDLEDLLHSKANKLSLDILGAVKDQILSDMRGAVESNDIITASKMNGYLKCVEDFHTLFTVHIQEALRSEQLD
jgi:hypothetical protein